MVGEEEAAAFERPDAVEVKGGLDVTAAEDGLAVGRGVGCEVVPNGHAEENEERGEWIDRVKEGGA